MASRLLVVVVAGCGGGCCCAGWSLAGLRAARAAEDEGVGPESCRRWCAVAARVMGGRLRSVCVCAVAAVDVEEAVAAEPCDGGLRMVALVSVVTDDFVRV